MGTRRATWALSLLLLLTLGTSIVTLYGQERGNSLNSRATQNRAAGQDERGSGRHFPEAEFDAPEPAEPEARAERRRKSSRYDKKKFVSRDPATHVTESAMIPEGYYVPAIPAGRSDLIVVGEVTASQAHLSNTRTAVYSEIAVRIKEVVKADGPAPLAAGDLITAQRDGGHVRYPNGHRRLYRIMGQGLPRVGGSYVLFLKAVGEARTYDLVTGYELLAEGVAPIDSEKQFAEYGGYEPAVFLDVVRAAASKKQ